MAFCGDLGSGERGTGAQGPGSHSSRVSLVQPSQEEPASLRSKLRRKLSGHPLQAYPWLGGGASEAGKGREGRRVG